MSNRARLAAGVVLAAGLAACSSGTPSTLTDAPTAAVTASASGAWSVIDCSGQTKPRSSERSEGDLGTDDVQVADVGGTPYVSVRAGAPAAEKLQVVDIIEGDGAEVQSSSSVAVNYCGIGLATRTLFDSSFGRGAPSTFALDAVIPGFSQGLVGMKTGGQRLLVIPGAMAYGENPPPGIEPNETLVFVVDMVATQ